MASPEEDQEKPGVPLENIASEWEAQQAIRKYLKSEDPPILFPASVNESVRTSVVPHVHALLVELLKRSTPVEGNPQPSVEPLRDEIARLYKHCSVVVDESQVVHDSWMLRKFLSFVKKKARLGLPSTAAWLQGCIKLQQQKLICYKIIQFVFFSGVRSDGVKCSVPEPMVAKFQQLVLMIRPDLKATHCLLACGKS